MLRHASGRVSFERRSKRGDDNGGGGGNKKSGGDCVSVGRAAASCQRRGDNSGARRGIPGAGTPTSLDHPWPVALSRHRRPPDHRRRCSRLSDAPLAINSLMRRRVSVCRSISACAAARRSLLAGWLAGYPVLAWPGHRPRPRTNAIVRHADYTTSITLHAPRNT